LYDAFHKPFSQSMARERKLKAEQIMKDEQELDEDEWNENTTREILL
jgi:hypothetical protein